MDYNLMNFMREFLIIVKINRADEQELEKEKDSYF